MAGPFRCQFSPRRSLQGGRSTSPRAAKVRALVAIRWTRRSLTPRRRAACTRRDLTGEERGGAAIVDATIPLGRGGTPRLAINPLLTSSERDEQPGFAGLLKGIFGMYRNPVAHDPRGLRAVTDDELLTVISMAHRRLDSARLGSRKL
jgi:uncharacterized protein (TIGR02391 family)